MLVKVGLFAASGLALASVALLNTPGKPADEKDALDKTRVMTYADDVAPILNQKCISCHRPGDVAPMSFVGYENAKKYSKMIAFTTAAKRMPPWKTIPVDVEFHDDNHLTDEEIALFANWAENDAPLGDPAKVPPTPEFPVGWRLGQPDLTLKMPYPQTLSDEGKDEYWNYVITPDIKEPIWVSAIDVKPGNKSVVHHVIAFFDKKGQGRKLVQGKDGDKKAGYLSEGGGVGFMPDGALGGWAPGTSARRLPEKAGFLIEPGTDIILQMHYSKSGKVETDQTEIALYLNKGKVTDPVEIAWMANPFIKIAANDPKATFKQRITLPATIEIYNVMPHMHLLGKEMRATATLPDGKKIRLVDVPNWDFNWQLVYYLKTPLVLPKGTTIDIEAIYDNSTDNPFNPSDPPKTVTWGEATNDEMMLLVAAYSVVKDGSRPGILGRLQLQSGFFIGTPIND